MTIDIVLLLITVIGGRIVPAFTASALRRPGLAAELHGNRWTDGFAIGAMIAVVLVDVGAPWQRAAGIVAALAGIKHLWRLAGWRSVRTLGEPRVWSLHLAYVWMPVGLPLAGGVRTFLDPVHPHSHASADRWAAGMTDERTCAQKSGRVTPAACRRVASRCYCGGCCVGS
jgi:uncharacterized protein involved in response to NO